MKRENKSKQEKQMENEPQEENQKRDIFDKLMSLPVLNIFEGFYKKNKEMLLYLFFGVLTTVVSFAAAGVAKVVLESLGCGKDLVSTTSTVFSWICAVTFAYITNRIWVFDSRVENKTGILAEAAKFYGGRLFTLLVETVTMWIGYSLIGANYWVTKIIANVFVLILNYIISKLFVFKKSKDE